MEQITRVLLLEQGRGSFGPYVSLFNRLQQRKMPDCLSTRPCLGHHTTINIQSPRGKMSFIPEENREMQFTEAVIVNALRMLNYKEAILKPINRHCLTNKPDTIWNCSSR